MRALLIATLVTTLLVSACGGGDRPSEQPPQGQQLKLGGTTAITQNVMNVPDYRGRYTIQKTDSGYSITNADTKVQTLAASTLKRIQFADVSLALDIDTSGKIYRLYQAAFNRKPDINGLGFWLDYADRGHALIDIAHYFLQSSEFQQLFGTAPNDQDFVTKLYNNVLHRAPDAGGLQFWLSALKAGTSREEALVYFSEGVENVAQAAAQIKDGILYVQPGTAYQPSADVGADQQATIGALIVLDGRNSSDANGDKLSFSWSLSKPAGSNAILNISNDGRSSFIADVAGPYTAELRVNDGQQFSNSDFATILISVPANQNISDTGLFKCSDITHIAAVQLFLQGHTYLDRDHDGKPCEATDISVEAISTPIITPVTPTAPSIGQCWVNGYYRKNGTYVKGYWRRC